MANQQHVDSVKALGRAMADFRTKRPVETPLELSGADLRRLDLSGVDLSNANLANAQLANANLASANLAGARLASANLDGANCRDAKIDGADLTDASFVGADVTNATFAGALLTRTRGLPSSVVAASQGGVAASPPVHAGFTLAVASLAIAGFALIFLQLRETEIGEAEYARGLITTVFAIGTMSIAFILVTARWWSNSADADNRFSQTKEVLALLIGILGTVVGWYFGHQSSSTAQNAAGPTAVAVQVVPHDVQLGKKPQAVKISGQIEGGAAPYEVMIEPIGQEAFKPIDEITKTGKFEFTCPILGTAVPSRDVPIRVRVHNGKQSTGKEYITERGGGLGLEKANSP